MPSGVMALIRGSAASAVAIIILTFDFIVLLDGL